MGCFVCRKSVIVRVRDDKGREYCGFDHREQQLKKELYEHFRELERREQATRLDSGLDVS